MHSLSALQWNYLGSFGGAATQFAALAILARLLDPVDFGWFSLALVAVGALGMISNLSIGAALIQKPHLSQAEQRGAVSFSFAAGLVGALLLATAGTILFALSVQPVFALTLIAIAPAAAFNAIGEMMHSIGRRNLDFKVLAISSIVAPLFGFGVVGTVAASIRPGPWALSIAQVGLSAIQLIVPFVFLRRGQHHWGQLGNMRPLVAFGRKNTLAATLSYLADQVDYLIIGRALGPAQLGVYSRAFQIMAAPARLIGSAGERFLFPVLALRGAKREPMWRPYRSAGAAMAVVALPGTVLIVVAAPLVVAILLGSAWAASWPVLAILALGMAPRMMQKTSGSVMKARNQMRAYIWWQALCVFLIGAGCLVGVGYGLRTTALFVTASLWVNHAVGSILASRILNMTSRSMLAAYAPGIVAAIGTAVGAVGALGLVRLSSPSMLTAALPWQASAAAIFGGLIGLGLTLAGRFLPRLAPSGAEDASRVLSTVVPSRLVLLVLGRPIMNTKEAN